MNLPITAGRGYPRPRSSIQQAHATTTPVVTLTRARVVAELVVSLGLPRTQTEAVVTAFEEFVVQPMELHLGRLKGRDLAKRNPMIYTVRGITTTEDWIRAVLQDKETSALEGVLGTWQEEVARIVSGGIKPANGVDLQVEDGDTVALFAIQTATNTKNAGGSKHDREALKRAAAVLRNQRRHVECYIAVLFGRSRTASLRQEPGIAVLASDEFWFRVSGVRGFRERLTRATQTLACLMGERSSSELQRIYREATALFDDGTGRVKIDALANPPRARRWEDGIQLVLPDV